MDKLIRSNAVRAAVRTRLMVPQSRVAKEPLFARHASSVPTIAQSSFWKSMIPKPFRRGSERPAEWNVPKKPKSKEWNPATFFIIIFLCIGSMSIQMIALKKDFDTFFRRAEVRIELLQEVVEKLQRGEEVDVEKTLGTGDAEKEKEWEAVLREIERDEVIKNAKKSENTKQPSPDSSKAGARSSTVVVDTEQPKTKSGGYSSFF